MGKIIKIAGQDIENVLAGVSRQYLAGNLKRPQELDFIKDVHVEVGITDYSEYATEPVHFHTEAVEYQYMLSGWTMYMDVDTGDVYEFKTGDFYYIEKNTTYAQKSKKGTRILFIKVPSINDKNVVKTSEAVNAWYEKGLRTVRKDYSHEQNMPEANSVRPAAAVAIINDDRILMLKRVDNGKWTMPGGTLELNESLVDCAIREVREESGLVIDQSLLNDIGDEEYESRWGICLGKNFMAVLGGTIDEHQPGKGDGENEPFQWIPIEAVGCMPWAFGQDKRIYNIVNTL